MFKRLLIANRGEIACRILRTARSMGISCVAVYSEADRNTLFVESADDAICIGPPPPQESYLNIPAVVNAALVTNCEAIHPGYGFLSENPFFARALEDSGLTLIGPSPKAMEVMGDKIKAKELARTAGVSVIPGPDQALNDLQHAQMIAKDIGFPVMLKAAAGGGGKGMRIVHTPEDLESAFERVKNESMTSFCDDRIFLEKFISNPRHIEFQILADQHGNVIHLGERECSLQRRHQKVIEEAPSPYLTHELRNDMAAQAVALAKAVDYSSAGTVEFVVGDDHQFYFLEMNTRLQVEHPVTEFITGLDLVEEMIRISTGEPLRHTQDQIAFTGHAIEARVYAEDSARGFLPSTGRLVDYSPPALTENLRLDTGVREGDIISPYYDPMLAKLIAFGPSRDIARQELAKNLDSFYIRGIETNTVFLSHLLRSEGFIASSIDTNTLDKNYPDGYSPDVPENLQIPLAAVAVMDSILDPTLLGRPLMGILNRTPYPLSIDPDSGCYKVASTEWTQMVETSWQPGQPLFQGVFNGHEVNLQRSQLPSGTEVQWEGYQASIQILTPRVAELLLMLPEKKQIEVSNQVLSPMPGLVVALHVAPGHHVKAGQPIAVIEAMKMENVIRAHRDAIIENVFVEAGQNISVDQRLVTLV